MKQGQFHDHNHDINATSRVVLRRHLIREHPQNLRPDALIRAAFTNPTCKRGWRAAVICRHDCAGSGGGDEVARW
ncbi:MAG: hypothetical protein JSS51_11865 [Planctomycetes bacterium]|nr:hypothetical protein [Planctomycetota bacterium]